MKVNVATKAVVLRFPFLSYHDNNKLITYCKHVTRVKLTKMLQK